MDKVLDNTAHFNEILSVIYREGQKMSWHDDGEEGETHLPRLLTSAEYKL